MTGRRPPPTGLERHWPLIRDVAGFLIGAFVLLWETVAEETAQPWLVAAGCAALGVTGSGVIQRWMLARLDK